MFRRALATSLASIAVAAVPGMSATVPTHVIYAPVAVAAVLHDGLPGARGLGGAALIQGPVATDPRWPASRQMAKLAGSDLARLGAPQIETVLRREIHRRDRAGIVGIDEIAPGAWTAAAAGNLATALDALGPDRARVVIYVSAGMVGGVGRVDPRQPLGERHAAVLGALRRAGAVQLETYYGDLTPFTAVEFATFATRWQARWAPGDPAALRLLMGPASGSVAQAEIWERARSSSAGRALLANGPGAYGLRSASEAGAWLAGYRAFLQSPEAPPASGDVAVPAGGGLTIARDATGPIVVALARPGRAVVELVPNGAAGGRVIRKLDGPFGATAVPIPSDTRPGTYLARVVAIGDGLRDEATTPVVVAAPVGLRLRLSGPRAVDVSVPRSVPTIVRLVPAGQTRGAVIRRIDGAPSTRVPLPVRLSAGRYTIVAVSLRGGREESRLPIRVRRDGGAMSD